MTNYPVSAIPRIVRVCSYFALLLVFSIGSARAEDVSSIEKRLARTAKYLSSDELEGRGIGTKGLDAAADYLHEQFKQLGLKTALYDGKPFQPFTIATSSKMGPKKNNRLTLVGPPAKEGGRPTKIELKLGTDFNPLAIGGSGKIDLPVVFVGYGITGVKEKYDDYKDIDVQGKAVIILRHEPQQNNPHSVFNGTKTSMQHAPFTRKVSNAYQHGAAAIIFCTGEVEIARRVEAVQRRWQAAVDGLSKENAKFKKTKEPTAKQTTEYRKKIGRLADDVQRYGKLIDAELDPVLGFTRAGPGGTRRDLPVFHCTRAALEKMLKPAIETDLAALEKAIDEGPKPHSRVLKGWRIVGQADVQQTDAQVKNVIAVLEGEGPLADETLVIGAHYDHLGMGARGSRSPGSNEIHNGADDNGSGTTVLLEVARRLATRQGKPRRRIVFIAFTGEERGLLGSEHYCENPLFPLEKTVAMLNMDMVGRLRDDKLVIHGTGTAKLLDELVSELSEKKFGFDVTRRPSGFGPSDQASFYAKKVPVLHFFTGTHADYHRPSDDFDKLNIPGMRRIGEMVGEFALRLAEDKAKPKYIEVKRSRPSGPRGSRPYFGSIPSFTSKAPGYGITGTAKDSPADKAGIKAGDSIIRFGKSKIGNLEDFDGALRKYKAGDKVPLVVLRKGKEVKLTVTLDPPR